MSPLVLYARQVFKGVLPMTSFVGHTISAIRRFHGKIYMGKFCLSAIYKQESASAFLGEMTNRQPLYKACRSKVLSRAFLK